jgi:23S rRNA pseudouridine1911/1915/1917 synthase
VGCPVLADKIYGGRDSVTLADLDENLPQGMDQPILGRQALHAFRLRFQHPRTGVWIEKEAPLPEDFLRTLQTLRQYRRWK